MSGIQTLRAFHMAGAQFQSLKRSFERERSAAIHMETGAAAPVSMLGRFVLSCGIGLVMLTGGVSADPRGVGALLLSGVFDPDTHYLRAGADPVYLLLRTSPAPAAAGSASRRCSRRGLCRSRRSARPHRGRILPSSMSHLPTGKKEVLHDISSSSRPGALLVLVGPSGSGKSTVTRLAARFWDVTGGAVRLGGVDVRIWRTDEILGRISVVFQDVYLFHDSIEANIRMGKPDATMEEIMEAAKAAACHDFIMALPDGSNHRGRGRLYTLRR